MLKKIIVGIFCFIILAVTAGGVYLYMLDWNQHKPVVESRFSQITGLNARIDGNLTVEIFPKPQFSASLVKFYKQSDMSAPLVTVNQISAHVDLWNLLNKKFILNAMTLNQANVQVIIKEDGKMNWSGVGASSVNKSGNIEVSFNDVRLINSVFSYDNKKENEKFEVENISASINAPSLKGPYKTDGKFIHNNSEIKFKGTIVKDSRVAINMAIENPSTSSKITIEGTLGANASGSFSFDTAHLLDVSAVAFGDGSLKEHYDAPLYLSFKYEAKDDSLKLENFNVAFGKDTKGIGSINLKTQQDKTEFLANFDMTHFNLNILQNLCVDMYNYIKAGHKFADTDFAKYNGEINLKSGNATYNNAAVNNLNFGASINNGILNLGRFGLDMPGNTTIKAAGKVDLNDDVNYQIDQVIKTADLRVLASIFNINLTKLAASENKKNIFKKAEGALKISGNMNNLKVAIPAAVIDSSEVKGNIGFIYNEGKTFVIADVQTSKVLFDKYLELSPKELSNASFERKLVHQLNLIPWNHSIDVEAQINVASGVYNNVPLENLLLEFKLNENNLLVKKLSVENMAGATLNLNLDASEIYTKPYFKEFTYDIKTSNLPQLISVLNIDTGNYKLFERKLFASQGALSGNCQEFSLSSVQKFGDTEFSYTGTVDNTTNDVSVQGELELKTNNFTSFVNDINLDYKPDIPVTSFTLNGLLKGSNKVFAIEKLMSHLGANTITGQFQVDKSEKTPKLAATLDFDKFDADHFFSLSKKTFLPKSSGSEHTFINKPQLSEEKIDYSALKSVNFDIKTKARQLVYSNKTYTDAKLDALLKDGVLKIADFSAVDDSSNINLNFILNTNNIPNIEGSYAVKAISLPNLGGSVYGFEGGLLDADGNFKSLATTQKEFFENIDSRGKFQLWGTVFKGWDLDIIKFEFEQRKNIDGFEDSILQNLHSGRSSFSKISGKYDISKGIVVSENTIWESPVANINMKLDFNLSNWLFTAVFNAAYLNASFSDILKFTYSGSMANPSVKTDLSDSIQRISETETMIKTALTKEKKEQQARLAGKINALRNQINTTMSDISEMTLDLVRFKPETNNPAVKKAYDTNLENMQETEKRLKNMLTVLDNEPDEKVLMDMEAELGIEKSKLQFIPKALEDNFVVDRKYAFDDIFNKIAWIYNVAQNNSSYYESLTAAYMDQIRLLQATETPLAEDKKEKLVTDMHEIFDDMENITALHTKIRESYLTVIDASKISEMNENNDLAQQALETIHSSTIRLNDKIVRSIDAFRAALDITSRDYDQYLVYPPKNVEDIDIKQPIAPSQNKSADTADEVSSSDTQTNKSALDEDQGTSTPAKEENVEDKKKDNTLNVSINAVIPALPENLNEEKLSSEIHFSGLSQFIKNSVENSDVTPLVSATKSETASEVQVAALDVAMTLPQPEKIVETEKKTSETDSSEPEPEIESDLLNTLPDNVEMISFIDPVTDDKTKQTLITTAIVSEINNPEPEEILQTPLVLSEDNSSLKDVVDFENETLQNNSSSTETETSTLKVNPVIAMDIGKEQSNLSQQDIEISIHRKSGFKKAKAAQPIVEDVPVSVAQNDSSDLPEPQPLKNTSQPAPQNVTKTALIDMLAAEHKEGKSSPLAKHLIIEDAPVYVEEFSNSHPHNQYIFANTDGRYLPTSGCSEKFMLKDKKKPSKQIVLSPKYIFATNENNVLFFSGSVHKNTSLYVK